MPGEDIPLLKSCGKLLDLAEIAVVSRLFAGLEDMQSMMEIIVPLRVQPKTTMGLRAEKPVIIQIALGNEVDAAAMALRELVDSRCQQREKRLSTPVDDSVHGVEA